jgi:acyl-CoA reductase-like NAD-dependent aldehyde dehydrogenase
MAATFQTISPADGTVYVERAFDDDATVERTLAAAREAATAWRQVPVAERAAVCTRFVDAMVARKNAVAEEITRQMGRPITQAPGEVRGLEERARYMIGIAEAALADVALPPKAGFTRFIRREPLGVVFTIAPWNYPYLTAVNSVVPALLAGNAVILKHSLQTPLCAERFAEAFAEAGLPEGVFQYLHLTHEAVGRVVQSPEVDFVAFTGSVAGGRAVQQAAAGRFIDLGLELGGKDPAYVRPDAPFAHTVENLVDGAFFNAGQSCCAVERIYVHEAVYDRIVEAFVEGTRQYVLGDPLDPATTLGPVVRAAAADFVREQVAEAVRQGARALLDPDAFPAARAGTTYVAPQVLVDVDHRMRLMTEETFGPAVGLMRVGSDEEAVALMNDSSYGLTASIWTEDEAAALRLGGRQGLGARLHAVGARLRTAHPAQVLPPQDGHLTTHVHAPRPDRPPRRLELPDGHPLRGRAHQRAAGRLPRRRHDAAAAGHRPRPGVAPPRARRAGVE